MRLFGPSKGRLQVSWEGPNEIIEDVTSERGEDTTCDLKKFNFGSFPFALSDALKRKPRQLRELPL